MKTKILKFVAGAALLSMIAGCITLSVYPFYNDKDLVFDSGLTGRWNNVVNTNEFWQFTASGEKSYVLTAVDADSTNCLSAHLFQLKGYQFMDLLTTNRGMFMLPLHLVSEVTRNDTNLSVRFLDYGWVSGLLETNPAALRHIVELANPDDTNSDQLVYLTAGTADLQKFLLKHAADTNAFNDDSGKALQRVQ